MPDLFLSILKGIGKKISVYENKIIVSLLFLFYLFFCYLATFPKHSDFWGIVAPGNPSFTGSTVYYNPLIGFFFDVWIRIGSTFFSLNLNEWNSEVIQYFCMIPFLLILLFFVIISYHSLKNKWLTFICFGTFSFVSIIVMGQVDIWGTFWIYIAIILALKMLETEDNLKYLFSSVFALGLSMVLKPFGGLIFPVFFIFFLILMQEKSYPLWIKINLLFLTILEFLLISFISQMIWPLFNSPPSVEAMWIFNLQLAPVQLPPHHTISIWLLGYVILLYDLWAKIQSDRENQLKKVFIFYIFATIAWLFISVYTYSQWWILLLPPFLLVLDNFEYRFNYAFYVSISVLFLFFTLQWASITGVLNYYIPIIPVNSLFSTIIITLISSVLLIWILEIRNRLFFSVDEQKVQPNNDEILKKIAPILPGILIVFLLLIVTILRVL